MGTRLLSYNTQLIQDMKSMVPQDGMDKAQDSLLDFAWEQDDSYMIKFPRKKNDLDYLVINWQKPKVINHIVRFMLSKSIWNANCLYKQRKYALFVL